jgi:hypothetical protein
MKGITLMGSPATIDFPKVRDMGKGGRDPIGKQINFRASGDLQSRLDDTAETLGLDVSALVRMILTENLHVYEARAAEVKSRNPGTKRKREG